MWCQDDATVNLSVTKLSFLNPEPSMSFLNCTFDNDSFEMKNDFNSVKENVPKEELTDRRISGNQVSDVEITLELNDLENFVQNSTDYEFKTELEDPGTKTDNDAPKTSNDNTFENFNESVKTMDHENITEQSDKVVKKKRKTSSQKRKWPEDPTDCDICGTHYTTKRSYQRHYKIVHELQQFNCQQCEAQFRWPEQLKQHKDEVHLGIFKTYPCDQCDKVCKDSGQLRRHKAKCHPPPSCDFCKITFKTLDEFNEHLRKEHIEKYCV